MYNTLKPDFIGRDRFIDISMDLDLGLKGNLYSTFTALQLAYNQILWYFIFSKKASLNIEIINNRLNA